ncbi:TadE/TadG family type IV pilus assembly protein [Aeoliella mucimassa]|uniref:TadE-like protein n=1 Tax=Aeoliella mucimassa TaxID=2527972 RepID=A0A518ANK1_9BACT|nr:TadE family protein [Aeoliella mucimassa]QDU56297.1 TadE-like protein [Aeoliella mucimassa]
MFRRLHPTSNRRKARNLTRAVALQRGVAAVEFAVVAPVFFLMVIGFIELGRGLMVQQVLTNASRVGVREAIGLHASEADSRTAAQEYAEGASVPGVTVTISPDPGAASAGTEITVNVSVPYTEVSWVPSPWFLGSTTLEAESVMRKEGFE